MPNIAPVLAALIDFAKGEGGRILATILIFFFSWFIGKMFKKSLLVQNAKTATGDAQSLQVLQRNRERMNTMRNGIVGVAIVMVFAIWGSRIAGFALSLAALAGGILLVCKDFIQNVLGLVMYSVTKPFRLGDHVEIDAIEGRVIDIGILSFSLIELGPRRPASGAVVSVPNGIFLSKIVHNLSATGEYVVRTLDVCLISLSDVDRAQCALRQSAQTVCAPWLEESKAKLNEFEHTEMVELSDVGPQVFLDMTRRGEFRLSLSYPCKTQDHSRVEQTILQAYVQKMIETGGQAGCSSEADELLTPSN